MVQLEQVKANLRDMVRSQKLPTDRQMMVARASALLSAATADCSQTQQQQQQCQQCAHRQMIISRKQRYTYIIIRLLCLGYRLLFQQPLFRQNASSHFWNSLFKQQSGQMQVSSV